MGQKDLSEKYLESFNDVFADIYNVLWFKDEVLQEEHLQAAGTETIYKAAEGKNRNQQRDVVKKYVVDGAVHYVLGIENESDVDADMPVRVMGYDYGNYRQMVDKQKDLSQVVTIVLNFSEKRWKKPTSLDNWATMPPKGWKRNSHNYGVEVYDVAYLPKEVRKKFKSDFGIVADFLAEKDSEDYQIDTRKIQHVEAVLELLRVFTKEERYEKIKSDIMDMVKKGEDVSMCKFVDRMVKLGEEKGVEKGIQQGIEQGIEQGIQQGGEDKLIGQVCKKLRKKKSIEAIADEVEEDISFVEQICQLAESFAPEYECQKVCQAWHLRKEKTA